MPENQRIELLTVEAFDEIRAIWPNPRNREGFERRMERWQRLLAEGKRIIFVCREENRCVGEAALLFDYGDPEYTIPGRRICLSEMTVTESRRNRGIGAALIRHVCAHAKAQGYLEMSLGVDVDNHAARHLYWKMGFTQVIREAEDEDGKYFKLL